ncbi:MAG TPA: ribonuclease HII [Bryobacteraceae bacterium]
MPKTSRRTRCRSTEERAARALGYQCVAGVDEVGRGCLFGPVFAAAVVLPLDHKIRGLADSKMIDAETRESLAIEIRARAVACAVGAADVFEIDDINILQASRLAMKRAVERLQQRPDYLLIDAITINFEAAQKPIIKGDASCQSIAAASILAKVARDEAIRQWDRVFPQYGLARHKGYYTPEHIAAIEQHGPTWMHRYTFAPITQPSLTFAAAGGESV